MCGINGIFKYSKITEAEICKIQNMNAQMPYRGPDDSGVWNDHKTALAQVRLSIIGVNNGHQPIFNEDKTIALVCNGEIYNYKELRNELIKKGHIFNTESDSEVIIHLYEEKGIDCLDNFRGMFAFAIYDINKEQMYIARDRTGKKPLYYSTLPDCFVFSSELKAINNAFLCESEINYAHIRQIMRYSYSQSTSKTFNKQIKKLKPGEYALISNDKTIIKPYWKKQNSYCFEGSYEEAKAQTLDILRESVALRLRSDVPIAILLSGGVDSSAVGALARETNDNIHAITVGYKGAYDCDERSIAKKFAKEKGLIWHELELDVNDYSNYFEELVEYLDEPVCDVAAIAQWGIYKKAKEEGFTVLLSGNGGDELFYGYGSHNIAARNIDFINKLKQYIACGKGRKVTKWIKFLLRNKNEIMSFLKTYHPHHFDSLFYNDFSEFKYDWPDGSNFSESPYNEYFATEKHSIDGVYSYLFNIWLINNCFFLSDKLGMAHSLEIRAPFADNNLIDFISTLPVEYRYNPSQPKGFLKDTLQGIVPNYILYGDKKGFTPPTEILHDLINKYNSKFFNVKLNSYNEILLDKFLYNFTKSHDNVLI